MVAGDAEGPTPLNAFDHALLDAGVGDTNLVRLSSILPPGTQPMSARPLPGGAMVPIAYAEMTSSNPGEEISAAVALALPMDDTLPGLIMEHHAAAPLAEVEATVRQMAIAGMEHRGRAIKDVLVRGATHIVEEHGSAFAAVVLWRND
ncbi:arginine decarboxylase, pyruvoyl-dependent [Myxococcota bacterium]|nr:arginine decarboxylase, pyruvoyl-dependent [Myxococcota bacterium]MBU1433148.1 arginine decarboxylase, pyruvoyl-dependent [Myxococcota bacterium]MBU1899299.1 arginine decarboxylase, pyruvoyl-dependent [Myxococcota bacterium]